MNYPQKIIIISYLLLFSCATTAELESKSRAGLIYSFGFDPKVSRFQKNSAQIDLAQFHRASLTVEVPMNRYLDLGFAFDATMAQSTRNRNPLLDLMKQSDRILTTLFGLSFSLKPQFPISFGSNDLLLYANFLGGLGASTLFTFGTQPLSDYKYAGTDNIPTPFPLYFEATPSLGLDFFFSSLVGIGIGAGYRMMWVMHPFVSVPEPMGNPKDGRSFLIYDLTSLFAMATVKLTI